MNIESAAELKIYVHDSFILTNLKELLNHKSWKKPYITIAYNGIGFFRVFTPKTSSPAPRGMIEARNPCYKAVTRQNCKCFFDLQISPIKINLYLNSW